MHLKSANFRYRLTFLLGIDRALTKRALDRKLRTLVL